MTESLVKHIWWGYIQEDLQELLKQSVLLIDIFADDKYDGKNFHDYSFIVFPAAKAYEGFLKTLFRDLRFMTDDEFNGKRFRIGKALNPALEPEFRERESIYDKLERFCQGRELPDKLWETWKNGRNLLFHWFPQEKNAINFIEARERVTQILDAMDLAFKECKINK